MSQSSATKLIPKLRFKVHDRRRLSNPQGPQGRHEKIKKIVTALLKYERIEMNYHKADESRGYAERLLSDAIRYGDTHKPTMEMASYWIIEKSVVHKLFKVLAPRYKDLKTSYTKLWRAPNVYHEVSQPKCVLELRNNIYPPLGPDKSFQKNLIHNILLEEAKKAYRGKKILEAQEKAGKEKKKVEMSNENQPDLKENVQINEKAGNADTESSKITGTDIEKESPGVENLKADSGSESEIKEKSEVNSAVEGDLDLNKMKIEEKQIESSTKEENK